MRRSAWTKPPRQPTRRTGFAVLYSKQSPHFLKKIPLLVMLFINLTRLCSSSKAPFSSALAALFKVNDFRGQDRLRGLRVYPTFSLSSLALVCFFNDYHKHSLAALLIGITVATSTTPKQLIPLISAAGMIRIALPGDTSFPDLDVWWFQELLYPLICTVVINRDMGSNTGSCTGNNSDIRTHRSRNRRSPHQNRENDDRESRDRVHESHGHQSGRDLRDQKKIPASR